jgi:hypothetical protein
MPIVADSKRRNAFSYRLKDKEREPEQKPEMPPDQMKVAEQTLDTAEKAIYESSKWLLNLSIAVKDPSPAQADILRERIRGLRDEVEKMRSIFGH